MATPTRYGSGQRTGSTGYYLLLVLLLVLVLVLLYPLTPTGSRAWSLARGAFPGAASLRPYL